MDKKLGKKPAFPMPTESGIDTMINRDLKPEGMSKRFYAACAAMQGILAGDEISRTGTRSNKNIVERAYKLSNELLKQEND